MASSVSCLGRKEEPRDRDPREGEHRGCLGGVRFTLWDLWAGAGALKGRTLALTARGWLETAGAGRLWPLLMAL